MDDQWLGGRVEFSRLLDSEREGFGDRASIVIRGGGMTGIVEQTCRRRRKLSYFLTCPKRNVKPLAVGGSLLMG